MTLEHGAIPVYDYAAEQFTATQADAIVKDILDLWQEHQALWRQWYRVSPLPRAIFVHLRLQYHLMELADKVTLLNAVVLESSRKQVAEVLENFSYIALGGRVQRHFRLMAQMLLKPPVMVE